MQLRATIQRQPNKVTLKTIRHCPGAWYIRQPAIIFEHTFSPHARIIVNDHDAAPIDLANVPCFASIRFPPL
nr:MAG TPA: hypothetical protein [Caudoviricetes sp.]